MGGEKGWDKLTTELELLTQCFLTLAEFAQGPCEGNQLALVRARVCRSVIPLLRFITACFAQVVEGDKKWQAWDVPNVLHELLKGHDDRVARKPGRERSARASARLDSEEPAPEELLEERVENGEIEREGDHLDLTLVDACASRRRVAC